MKQPYDPVTLRVSWWDGEPAEIGDELITRTGRRYQILAVRAGRLDCMVLPPSAEVIGAQFKWTWNGRNKRC